MEILNTTLHKKLLSIIGATGFLACGIIVRLFYLQIVQHETFTELGQRNFLRVHKVMPPRGNIIDTHGNLLATNRPITNVYWQGSGNRNLTCEQTHDLHILGTILHKDFYQDDVLINTLKYAERFHRSVPLARDISFEELSKIKEQFPTHINIVIKSDFKRLYPYGPLAAHILGYLGTMNFNMSGQMGLEKLLEETLQGKPGEIANITNSIGKSLAHQELKQAHAGSDICITLDLSLQQLAEKLFPEEEVGALIIMDPVDGALLTVVSHPTFDPNMFLDPIPLNEWASLQNKQPFLNRAFNACYPPASIFKLVTITAALELNLVKPEDEWNCKGYVRFGNRKYYCNRHSGHGVLTTEQALAQSCNPLFYEIGKQISIDTLAACARKFGLGSKTHILFPEKAGLVPTKEWKLAMHHEPWQVGETLSAAIGQSFLLATPLQIACMISGIFQGYLVTPRILTQEPVRTQPLNVSPSILEFLRNSMRTVVTQGTGHRMNRIKDIEVYAKTGTAQTSSLSKRNLGRAYMEHGLIVLYVRYKDFKPFTMVILIEHAGAAAVATDLAKHFLVEYKKLMDAQEKQQPHAQSSTFPLH